MVATSNFTVHPRPMVRIHRPPSHGGRATERPVPFLMMTPHPAPPGGAFFMAPGSPGAAGTHAVRARPWHRCINGGQSDACIPS